jgi:hypothetical protein
MDERRDLVDRAELRRILERDRALHPNLIPWTDAFKVAVFDLNEMPVVECPRGWTRDEVLAELDADPDAVCKVLGALTGRWHIVPRWAIAEWHPEVRRYDVRVVRVVRVAPEPEWVPLTQLVGRTIHGCTGVVDRNPSSMSGKGWRWYDGHEWHRFPDGTLNLETGQVAVRPKGEA